MAMKFITAERTNRSLRFQIQLDDSKPLDPDKPLSEQGVVELVYGIPANVTTAAQLAAFALQYKKEAELLLKAQIAAAAPAVTKLPFEGATF